MRAIRSQGVWDLLWETGQMAYTTDQLVALYKNANLGQDPDAATKLTIDAYATQSQVGGISDATALTNTLKLVNSTTAVAIETYQFFTGKAPSAAGLAYLVHSDTNTADLNDAYYAKFSQENRFINFAINLGVFGDGATSFAATYGAGVTYGQVVASAHDKIIGNTVAQAAGVDVAASVAFFSRQANIDYLTAFVKANTGLTDAAKIELAVKAALIGEILNAATQTGLGGYAKATASMILDLSDGTLTSSDAVNIFTAYPAAPVAGNTLTLTAGINELVGTAGDDLFDATETAAGAATFTNLDKIDGGAGVDTLRIVQTGAINLGTIVGTSVTNIEKGVLVSGGAVTADVTTWSGLTSVTATAGGDVNLTAANTTAVNVGASALTAGVTVNGGNGITILAADTATTAAASGNTINVGQTTAASGVVAVSYSESVTDAADAGITGAAINVKGGSSITVNNTATVGAGSAAADVYTFGTVNVTGTSATTSVTVKESAAIATWAAAGDSISIVNGAVNITDGNAATAADTLTSVTAENTGALTVTSTALTNLSVKGTGATVLNQSAADTTTAATTLNLTTAGTVGAISGTQAAVYTTLNLSASAASTIGGLTMGALTTLNISGAGKATISALTAGSLTSIVSTGAGGATITPVLANNVSFTGGAGVETISIGATTKAIDMGDGNDVVTISTTTLGAGGSVKGGAGTDTLVANTNGSAIIGLPAFSGFEVLRVAGAAAQGTHNTVGFTALEVGATAGATVFSNVAAGVGLTSLAANTGGVTVTLADATGTADTFALGFRSAAAQDLSGAKGITINGVETINITNTDTSTTSYQQNKLNLTADSVTKIVVTGNAGLDLTGSTYAKVTTFDASGITGPASEAANLAVKFTSGNTTVAEAVTILGGSGNDVLTGSATANDTINGGAGNDTLVYTGGSDVFTGGAGADTFSLTASGTKTSFLNVTDATTGDKFDFTGISTGVIADAALGAKITLGAAATFDQYLDSAAAGNGGTNALVTWFQYNGDTYLVVDNSAGATFVGGTDAVIKLTGTVTLTGSALATEVLTLA